MAKRKSNKKFRFELAGKVAVFIDWANVYKWKEKLARNIDLPKLIKYLKTYQEVDKIGFYFGTEEQPFSKIQLKEARKAGCKVVTKPVKFLPKVAESGETVWVRKCDFDLEIGLDAFEALNQYDGFMFFSGDGDFATLYKRLVKRGKQVVVVFASGSLGKEIWQLRRGVFMKPVDKLGVDVFKKISPRRRRGAQ